MNILYISNFPPNKDCGPYWSVPSQVVAQSKFDNVLWYNRKKESCELWRSTNRFICKNDYPDENLNDFPVPFDNPDLVIYECFYDPVFKIHSQVLKANIPYVIVPRGGLTDGTQKKHRWRKVIGNFLFYSKFARNASAIHYLTKDEAIHSSNNWNKRSFIIPNGVISVSDKQWVPKVTNGYKGIFIGRISIFQKGLDLLVEACAKVRQQLIDANLTIDIFGPDREGDKLKLINLIREREVTEIIKVNDFSLFGEDKENALIMSDFFVLTSRMEGHPMGLLEALSYGLPSIVTKGSNMMTEINNNCAGWCAENTSESISKALLQLIKDKGKMHVYSKNAIALAQKYKWDSIAKQSHDIYVKLLSNIKYV